MTAMSRRRLLAGLTALGAGGFGLGLGPGLGGRGAWAQTAAQEQEQEVHFARIGTGRTSGAYFPVGGLIASAISNPPGSRPCAKGGSCGVPNLIAVAQSTGGSVDNITGLREGTLDLAICQADVAYNAFLGTHAAEGVPGFESLRAIATLYSESLHLVVRDDSAITSVTDIAGHRVSLGEPGSGTLVSVRRLLAALGLAETDLEASYDRPGASGDRLVEGSLDAFFFFGGEPVALVTALRDRADIRVVPIEGPGAEALASTSPYLTLGVIRQNAYDNPLPIATLQVGAVLVTTAEEDETLIEAITTALWHPQVRQLYTKGPPQMRGATPERAVQGTAVPLHPGAARFYRLSGILERGGPLKP